MVKALPTHCLSFTAALFSFLLLISCRGQHTEIHRPDEGAGIIPGTERVGGPFENRDLMFVGMPPIASIKSVDTTDFFTVAQTPIRIEGTIFYKDGKTPAPDVVLYYYHTNDDGRYVLNPDDDARLRPHGSIRGWVKSDDQGQYAIYTGRPGSYPNSDNEAHIHPAIKERRIAVPYYIDEFVFDDDTLLTEAKRRRLQKRGGSGILRLVEKNGLPTGRRDIILGLNIPHYPQD